MAFGDPLTITIAGVAQSLARILTDGARSIYQKNDENVTQLISHQKSKERIRSLVKTDQRIIAADVLSAENKYQTMNIQIVFDRPLVGFTAQQVKDLWTGLKNQINDAYIDRLYGQET